jgi:hypothetical protein
MRYRLTIRTEGQIDKLKFDSLDTALAEVESIGRERQRTTRAKPVDTKILGRYEPAQQVAARLELAGPRGLRAGVDVRGDGSASAYTGRIRRQPVEERQAESPYEALRRTLASR